MAGKTYNNLLNRINLLPAIDAHTHLDSSCLCARGLHDIMLYHMIVSELYSAGCPTGSRLSDEPDEKEKTCRIEEAVTYLNHIQNTSSFWLMRTILEDLYGLDEPITVKNWRKLDEIIQKKASSKEWGRQILQKANVKKASTEIALRGDGKNDDILFYSLEWAFFTRNQWGVYDAPLYELEYAWQFDKPVRPLPVTLKSRPSIKKNIKTVEDIKKAMTHYCKSFPFDKVIATAQHISTDIDYTPVTDEQMQEALNNRKNAGPKERDIYASYLIEIFLCQLEDLRPRFIYQFSLGAEPLPFETDCRLNQETIKHIAGFIYAHPKLKFQCFLANKHCNQSLISLCRELPNFSLVGYWWHNFYPCNIAQLIDERMDMLPVNKQIGYFSDAYCAEWLYAKNKLVRMELTNALMKRIERNQYSPDQAVEIAEKLLFKTPKDLFGLNV